MDEKSDDGGEAGDDDACGGVEGDVLEGSDGDACLFSIVFTLMKQSTNSVSLILSSVFFYANMKERAMEAERAR